MVTIATVTSERTLKHLTRERADSLYKEASLVSGRYATQIYEDRANVEIARAQLRAIDTYISAQIWLINNNGKVIFNSRMDEEGEMEEEYTEKQTAL